MPLLRKVAKNLPKNIFQEAALKRGESKRHKRGKEGRKIGCAALEFLSGLPVQTYIYFKITGSSQASPNCLLNVKRALAYYVWQLCLSSSPSAPFPARTVAERE